MKLRLSILFVLALTLIVTSCDGYNRVIKSDDYNEKFEEANRLYDDGKYERCLALYEQVYQRSPKSAQGETAFFRMGMACYNVEDWYLASYYLASFPSKFPYSRNVEEAMYLAAICAVKNSPEPSLDQAETEAALNELQVFVMRFPNSERVDTCNQIMDNLRFKLQTKEVLNVRLYSKTFNYRAAVVCATSFLEDYPVSTYREEVMAILLRNSYLLAVNSVEKKVEERIEQTSETYSRFLAEFPESSYLREFDSYPAKLEELRELNKTNNK